MAVVQLYYHVAPRPEVNIVVKALIRLLRSHTEVQAVVLSSIAAMSTSRQVQLYYILQSTTPSAQIFSLCKSQFYNLYNADSALLM